MQSQWFVIHTLSGQEQKVKESIEKRLKKEEMGEFIKEVLVPVEKVVDVRGGKKTVTTRKLHPGYVYIDMVLLDDNKRILDKPWYFIQDTPGKIGIVGGERPLSGVRGHRRQVPGAGRGRPAELHPGLHPGPRRQRIFGAEVSAVRHRAGRWPAAVLRLGLTFFVT